MIINRDGIDVELTPEEEAAFLAEVAIRAPVHGSEVNQERDRRFALGFRYGGVIYQSDPDSRENVAGAGTMALGAIITGKQPGDLRWARPDRDFTWTAADNSQVPMDAQTVFAFAASLGLRKDAFIKAAQTLKAMDPIPADFATNDAYWPPL
jgi:hypothetical protein